MKSLVIAFVLLCAAFTTSAQAQYHPIYDSWQYERAVGISLDIFYLDEFRDSNLIAQLLNERTDLIVELVWQVYPDLNLNDQWDYNFFQNLVVDIILDAEDDAFFLLD